MLNDKEKEEISKAFSLAIEHLKIEAWSIDLKEVFEVIESTINSKSEERVMEIISQIEERMFQIREKGEEGSWKTHKELCELRDSLQTLPKKEE